MNNIWYLDDVSRYSVVGEERGLTFREHHSTKGPIRESPIFTDIFLPYPVELSSESYGLFSGYFPYNISIVGSLNEAIQAFSSDSRDMYIWNLARCIESSELEDETYNEE